MTPLSTPRLPQGLRTPVPVLDLDVVEHNIAAMADLVAARGAALRPHVKTHKSTRIARMQLEAGAAGLTCATLGEAAVMAAAGLHDLFVAYPVWGGGPRAAEVRDLHDGARLRVGVDSPEGAGALAAAVAGSRRPLEVLVELDSGQHRSGVAPEQVVDVARAARGHGLAVVGVFTHGGHAYGSPDAPAAAAADERAALARAAALLADDGVEVQVRSAGSTPTGRAVAGDGVDEVRVGTYVVGDRQQMALGGCAPDEIGMWVAATVVSRAVGGQCVLDAGAKALAKDRPAWLEGHGVVPALGGAVVERVNDHHGVVRLPADVPAPAPGTVVAVVPNHACPAVNLTDELVVARDGELVGVWPVDARGRS